MMFSSSLTRSAFAVLAVLSATAASAHPGHGDHDFGWDFTAAVNHPWSPFQVMGFGVAAALAAGLVWARRRSRG